EELLAAIAALSDEEKAKVLEMLQGGGAADDSALAEGDEDEEPSAEAQALAKIRELLGGKVEAGADAVVAALTSKLETLAKSVDALTADNEARDFELTLSANAKRVAPALAKSLRDQFKAKTLSLAGAKAIVSGLP